MVGKTDPNLIDGFDGAFERLYQHSKSHSFKSNCQKCLWNAKKFKNSKQQKNFLHSEVGGLELVSLHDGVLLPGGEIEEVLEDRHTVEVLHRS